MEMILLRMIQSKTSVSHEIILGAVPLVIGALFQTITHVHQMYTQDVDHLPRLALESSMQLTLEEEGRSWYSQVVV